MGSLDQWSGNDIPRNNKEYIHTKITWWQYLWVKMVDNNSNDSQRTQAVNFVSVGVVQRIHWLSFRCLMFDRRVSLLRIHSSCLLTAKTLLLPSMHWCATHGRRGGGDDRRVIKIYYRWGEPGIAWSPIDAYTSKQEETEGQRVAADECIIFTILIGKIGGLNQGSTC